MSRRVEEEGTGICRVDLLVSRGMSAQRAVYLFDLIHDASDVRNANVNYNAKYQFDSISVDPKGVSVC